jgi:AraC-like DNA-binding protein
LRHRLSDEGQSYASIKDDIRRDMAVDMLLNTPKTIGDIATQLGYSEPSAFFRAFRKWMSTSPDAFRRESRQAVQTIKTPAPGSAISGPRSP